MDLQLAQLNQSQMSAAVDCESRYNYALDTALQHAHGLKQQLAALRDFQHRYGPMEGPYEYFHSGHSWRMDPTRPFESDKHAIARKKSEINDYIDRQCTR